MICLCCTAPDDLSSERTAAGVLSLIAANGLRAVMEGLCMRHSIEVAHVTGLMLKQAEDKPPPGHAA